MKLQKYSNQKVEKQRSQTRAQKEKKGEKIREPVENLEMLLEQNYKSRKTAHASNIRRQNLSTNMSTSNIRLHSNRYKQIEKTAEHTEKKAKKALKLYMYKT